MSQFNVYRNPNKRSRRTIPYLVDLQVDLLGDLRSRVVAPLVVESMMQPAQHLNPTFEIEGKRVVMSTAELAGIPLDALGEEVTTLKESRDEIIGALDFLFTGV